MTRIKAIQQRCTSWWSGWSYPTRFVVLFALMVIGYKLSILPARYHWYPPAGFCMAAFVLLPKRYWLTVIFAEWYHRTFWMNLNWWFADNIDTFIVTTHIQFVPYLLVAIIYRPYFHQHGVRNVRGVLVLLLIMFAEAVAGALTNGLLIFTGYFDHRINNLRFLTDVMLGNGIGNFVSFAPMLALASLPRHGWLPLLRSLLIWFVPAIALLLIVARFNTEGLPPGYLRLLAQLPGIFIAWRHGWPGAAIAFSLSSSANRYFPEADFPRHVDDPTTEMTTQMFVMVLGVTSYFLGVAASTLRDRQHELEARNIELMAAGKANQMLAENLREAANRNLQLESTQRREIASALHDEFGQNLTAMTVRLKLAEKQVSDATLLTPIRQVIDHMRNSVRRLLDSLSPAALEEFGLWRALTEGPVRAMVEDSGLGFHIERHDPHQQLDSLPEHVQASAYRIIQEAATNAVRHARARSVWIRLSLLQRHGNSLLILDIRDDGVGITPPQKERRRYGLQGIQDRTLAANGKLHLRSDARGTRLHVLLRVG